MIYSPTIAAIIGLNGAHDSVLLKLAKVKCPIKKANFERQELRIMSCLLELLDTLPEKEKKDLLQRIR